MTVVAIIPARGGSVRIQRKNIRLFHGKPIIAYSIETALSCGLFDAGVWVSTEDAEIAAIALQHGARHIPRPPHLAEVNGAPDPGTQAVTRHGLYWLEEIGIKPEIACCIYPTAPLMSPYDLWRGYGAVKHDKGDYAYAVGGQPFVDAGQFYFGWTRCFLDRVTLDPDGDRVWKIAIEPGRFCDINTEEDFTRAESMYRILTAPPQATITQET